MKMLFGVVGLLCAVFVHKARAQNCGNITLYPSGPEAGDSMVTDDVRLTSAGQLNLPAPIVFGSNQYYTLYVTDDGTITFGTEYNPEVNVCPLPDASATAPFVAMYWTDFDPFCNNHEAIGYRYSQDTELLQELSQLVRCCNLNDFDGTIAVIATYTRLTAFDCEDDPFPGLTTTFQGIIISDTYSTYLLTNFVELDLPARATIGVQYTPEEFFSNPLSCLENTNIFSNNYYRENVCGGVLVSDNLGNLEIDECASSPCQNGGSCEDKIANYTCTCAAGYNGFNCDQEIDECASSPCQNGGSCEDKIANYTCTCAAGYNGFNCDQDCRVCFHCEASRDMTECERIGSYKPCTTGSETKATITGNGQNGSHTGHTADDFCPETPKCITQYHNRGNNKRVEMYCLKDACIHKSYEVKLNEECGQTRKESPKCIEVNNPKCKTDEL